MLLLFKMIPYFRCLSRHGWLLIINCLTTMLKGPAVIKKKTLTVSDCHDFLYLALQIKRPPAFYTQASRQSHRLRHSSKCLFFVLFFSCNQSTNEILGRLMSFRSTSAWSTIWAAIVKKSVTQKKKDVWRTRVHILFMAESQEWLT